MSGGSNQAAHNALKRDIRVALGAQRDCRIFNNPQGLATFQSGVRGMAGLGKHTSDLVAIVRRVVPPHLLREVAPRDLIQWLQPQGIWLAIECKTGNARADKGQRAFLKMVRDLGGVSGIARSVEDALALLREARGSASQKPSAAAGPSADQPPLPWDLDLAP